MKKKNVKTTGWVMILVGCIALCAGMPTRLSNSNIFLLSCLFLTIAGIVVVVKGVKDDSRY